MRRLLCLTVAALFTGCGGGDGGGGHPPTISNLQYSPTSALVGADNGTFTVSGNFYFTDSGGDLATLHVRTYDHSGNPVGALSTPLIGVDGATTGTLYGSITFNTNTADVYRFELQVVDSAGDASNILRGAFTVASQLFSQADVTGTWDVVSILSGGNAGWFHSTRTFDSSGNVTAIANDLDSAGNTHSGPWTLKWGIDSAGLLHEFDNNVFTGFRGRMSSDTKMICSAGTHDVSPITGHITAQMTVARKRTGTVFGNADLAGMTFAYHALTTGSVNHWEYGAGFTNGSGQIAITSTTVPPDYAGSPLAPASDTLSVSPEGIVTLANDNTFYGLMTDDKTTIFAVMGTQTAGYGFMVIMVTGQTFTQADYSGIRTWVALRNFAPYPVWADGVAEIDAAGNGSYLSYADSSGGPPNPSTFTRYLSTTGVITDPADGTFHGQMSYNKDITVRTNTTGTSNHGMNFSIR